MARTPRQREAARARVRKSMSRIIERYRDGESMNKLAAAFGVSPNFLAGQFDAWGEPRRDMTAAQMLLRAQRMARANARLG